MRKLIISLILETDMSKHFSSLGNFKSRANLKNIDIKKEDDKKMILQIALKCADISHAAKEWDLH